MPTTVPDDAWPLDHRSIRCRDPTRKPILHIAPQRLIRCQLGWLRPFGVLFGMYWLLDTSAEVRLAGAEGFRERAQREIVEPISTALVPLVCNWMPPDAGRTLMDEALREARRRELFAPLPPPTRRREESLGSIPDKWGTKLLRAMLQGGDEPVVATVRQSPGAKSTMST